MVTVQLWADDFPVHGSGRSDAGSAQWAGVHSIFAGDSQLDVEPAGAGFPTVNIEPGDLP